MNKGRWLFLLGGAGAGLAVTAALLLGVGSPRTTPELYRLADYGGRVAVYGPGESALPGKKVPTDFPARSGARTDFRPLAM